MSIIPEAPAKKLTRGRPKKYKDDEREEKYKERALSYYHAHKKEIKEKRQSYFEEKKENRRRKLKFQHLNDEQLKLVEALLLQPKLENDQGIVV